MEKASLHITRLCLQKLPGFPSGLALCERFSPKINLIVGPNASGKSSTARALQRCIWQNPTSDFQARCVIDVKADSWEVLMDGGHTQVLHQGREASLPGLPPGEAKEGYMLALHELVRDDDRELARLILQEAMGGYDLDRAAQRLEYEEAIRNTRTQEYREYIDASTRRKEVEDRQRALRQQEQTRSELSEKLETARHAAQCSDLYARAAEYCLQREEYLRLQKRIAGYPSVLEQMKGDEYELLQQWQQNLEAVERDIDSAHNEVSGQQERIASLKYAHEGIEDEVLDEMESRIETLEMIAREKEETLRALSAREAKARTIASQLGVQNDPSEWPGVDAAQAGQCEELMFNAHALITEKQSLASQIATYENCASTQGHDDPATIQEGIRALAEWLSAQKKGRHVHAWWLVLLSGIGAMSTVCAIIWGWPPGLAGIALCVLVTVYGFLKPFDEEAKIRMQDYESTALSQPREWTEAAVSDMLGHLHSQLYRATEYQRATRTLDSLYREMEGIMQRLHELEKEYDGFWQQLGAAPALPGDEKKGRNYSALSRFMHTLVQWQDVHSEAAAYRAQMQRVGRQYDDTLQQLNALVGHYCRTELCDEARARALYKKLRNEQQVYRDSMRELQTQYKRIEEKKAQRESITKRIEALYDTLGIEYGDQQKIAQLERMQNEYAEEKKNWHIVQARTKEKEEVLRAHSLYSSHKGTIEHMSHDQATRTMHEYRTHANTHEGISNSLAQLDYAIDQAKEGNELESALAREDAARQELGRRYHENVASITGSTLVELLKEETSHYSQSRVMARAGELFTTVTQGRYEFRVEERENEPQFFAYDTLLCLLQPLAHLSTGTRIQLLLATRIAFIETREHYAVLPVFADELLANSDDVRAAAIIDALLCISRQGRQVFYFTAQWDEVAKWRAVCAQHNISNPHIVSLGACTSNRDEKIPHVTENLEKPQLVHEVPEPGDAGRDAYRRALHVPSFSLLQDQVSRLHLWYCIENTHILYECMRRGITRWGQLESFITHNGTIETLDEETMSLCRRKVRLLQQVQDLYARGRSKPIDRSVIERSGAVSETFIDEVTRVLTEVDNDPQRLIQQLKNGNVRRFKQAKAAQLEAWLIENEYIDTRKRLHSEQMRVRIQALCTQLGISFITAQHFLDDVLPISEIEKNSEV